MSEQSFPRQQRLRGERALQTLFAKGRRGYVFPFKYCVLMRQASEPTAVMFSVPKKLHKRAVRRNLLRRRTKESYRLRKATLFEALKQKGISAHIALIYDSKEIFDYKTIDHAVQKILDRIASHA